MRSFGMPIISPITWLGMWRAYCASRSPRPASSSGASSSRAMARTRGSIARTRLGRECQGDERAQSVVARRVEALDRGHEAGRADQRALGGERLRVARDRVHVGEARHGPEAGGALRERLLVAQLAVDVVEPRLEVGPRPVPAARGGGLGRARSPRVHLRQHLAREQAQAPLSVLEAHAAVAAITSVSKPPSRRFRASSFSRIWSGVPQVWMPTYVFSAGSMPTARNASDAFA